MDIESFKEIFRDKRTKKQIFWDNFWFYAFIITLPLVLIGIGVAIGIYYF